MFIFEEKHTSKIAFLFISFIVVASGYVTQVLPCQTQKFLENNVMAKHVIGVLISFLFIMLEGGWSFDMETQDKEPVDWSNGNVIDSMIFGLALYVIFLLSAKMKLIPNLLLYVILFGVYLVNTQRLYWKNREMITQQENDLYLKHIHFALITSVGIFLYGIIDYLIYQKSQYKQNFSLITFILGNNKCSSLK